MTCHLYPEGKRESSYGVINIIREINDPRRNSDFINLKIFTVDKQVKFRRNPLSKECLNATEACSKRVINYQKTLSEISERITAHLLFDNH